MALLLAKTMRSKTKIIINTV